MWDALKLLGANWKLYAIIIAIVFTLSFGTGWKAHVIWIAYLERKAQNEAIEEHLGQEKNSFQAGKDVENAKREVKEKMRVVTRVIAGDCKFAAAGVRETSELIAAGEAAIKREP